ncbi:hypothetical protein J437_LFUL005568 [Ladona fulva]|uniref:NHR domain-containing protein n=1 Tax=Ladona fulva TaxID=123851 RepID=A0A8K0K7U2_LADFU|nr:hypothetical protein J437_LFUL005568 [Ladona fulva]
MFPSSALLLATFSLFFAALANFGSTECNTSPKTEQSFSLSLQSKKFEREKWINSFSLNGYLSNESDALLLDLQHEIVNCGGERKFHIQGTLKEAPFKNLSDGLAFHPKCGINVALFNNGHSLKKLNVEDRINGVVFTNRPLKINEVFEVKVDNKINKLGYFMGIGVTTHSPNEIEAIPGHYNGVKTGTWMLYHNHVFNNGNVLIKENDQHLDKLQVGDRVGIMISEFGSLHLFINGADKGPVASGIPSSMSGIFEFYGDVAQVTLTSKT